jgi:hypothetical protein
MFTPLDLYYGMEEVESAKVCYLSYIFHISMCRRSRSSGVSSSVELQQALGTKLPRQSYGLGGGRGEQPAHEAGGWLFM